MPEPIVLNDRYKLEERIGSGGMAVVYRAHDLTLERNVAIKLLRENFSINPAFQERFRQEAKAAANLSHPNIVTVHDFGLDAGRIFIVMEYVPGTDLKSILQRKGRIPEKDTISIIVQACAGVGYAHRSGLVHCDIKPHNMLITPDKRLKVTDFGIARALASIQPEEQIDVVWGSPSYFSPEQAAGHAPSPASDVYSLGIVMFEMLTGQLPFSAKDGTELARMHREVHPPPVRQLNPTLSPALEQILLKVLSKEPSSRYRTADQMGRVLITATEKTRATTSTIDTKSPSKPYASRAEADTLRRIKAEPERPNGDLHAPADKQTARRPTPAPAAFDRTESNPLDIDWGTIALGLLALITVGGLIPFYMWLYFLYQ